MKKQFVMWMIFIALSLALLSGCSPKKEATITCPENYLVLGTECCLDINHNKICDSDEKEPQEENKTNIVEKEIKSEMSFSPIDINAVLDDFYSIYHRYVTLREDEETRIYRKYKDIRVDVYEFKDPRYYITNYKQLFDFVIAETRAEAQEDEEMSKESSYVRKLIVEEDGISRHISISRHWITAWMAGPNLLGHNYVKRMYTWCAPNIVIRIKAEKGVSGLDTYTSLQNLLADVVSQGKTFNEGIRKKSVTREYVLDNFKTLRLEGSCQEIPEEFNEGFTPLHEEEMKEVNWDFTY